MSHAPRGEGAAFSILTRGCKGYNTVIAPEREVRVSRASLLVILGVDQGARFELNEQTVELGRGIQNAIRIRDTEASRIHARLAFHAGRYELVDLHSSNGTYVNGQPIRSRELADGDEIQVGRTVLRFTLTGQGATPRDASDRVALLEERGAQDESQIVDQAGPHEPAPGGLAASQTVANLHLLYRIAEETVRPSNSLDQLLDRVLEHSLEVTNADRACVLLRDLATGQFAPRLFRKRPSAPGASAGPDRMGVSRSIVDYVLKTRQGVRTSDARADARFAPGQSIVQAGIREAICVPMQGRHDLQGVIYLDITTPPERVILEGKAGGRFNEELLRLMVAVGRQSALAVEDHHYQQALVKAERLAAVGQTIAILSHHIKNILQGVRGGSYLIDMGLEEQKFELVRKGWRIVEKNQGKIYHLVMDMLSFSKDRQPVLQQADLNQTVADVCELLQGRARDVAARFEFQPGRLPLMLFDPEALHRAVLNVVGNALDAVEGCGQARVTVATAFDEAAGVVSIIVEDNGPGIPDEVLPVIFNIFESTKGGRGTGIGLAVSQKIIREHGGEILVQSQPGSGARFTLEWPLITEPPRSADAATSAQPR
jgi:signal transduction histidine kinase/pSer/pThr/pTyr-binding forkhead associated (FHA) protein